MEYQIALHTTYLDDKKPKLEFIDSDDPVFHLDLKYSRDIDEITIQFGVPASDPIYKEYPND